MTETKKRIHKENLSRNTKKLTESGLFFESFNNGLHLKGDRFDFWPSTGLWIINGVRGFGIEKMISSLKVNRTVKITINE